MVADDEPKRWHSDSRAMLSTVCHLRYGSRRGSDEAEEFGQLSGALLSPVVPQELGKDGKDEKSHDAVNRIQQPVGPVGWLWAEV